MRRWRLAVIALVGERSQADVLATVLRERGHYMGRKPVRGVKSYVILQL